MKKQIVRISPFQAAKLFTVLNFLMSLPVVGVTIILFLFSPYPGPGIEFLVMYELLYLAFGFVVPAAGAQIYNVAAKWVGGIEYTSISLEDSSLGSPGIPTRN